MKVLYDPDKDILQVSFNKDLIEETAQLSPGLILDYNEDGKVVGFELREASKRVDNPCEMTHIVGDANLNKPPLKGSTYV